jgi:hypothetical protein
VMGSRRTTGSRSRDSAPARPSERPDRPGPAPLEPGPRLGHRSPPAPDPAPVHWHLQRSGDRQWPSTSSCQGHGPGPAPPPPPHGRPSVLSARARCNPTHTGNARRPPRPGRRSPPPPGPPTALTPPTTP